MLFYIKEFALNNFLVQFNITMKYKYKNVVQNLKILYFLQSSKNNTVAIKIIEHRKVSSYDSCLQTNFEIKREWLSHIQ